MNDKFRDALHHTYTKHTFESTIITENKIDILLSVMVPFTQKSIDDPTFNISKAAKNCLKKEGLYLIKDLLKYTTTKGHFWFCGGIGEKRSKEIMNELKRHNVSMADDALKNDKLFEHARSSHRYWNE